MPQDGEGNATRRTVLEQLGQAAVALPLLTGATTQGAAERGVQRPDLFKVWAADHLEIDYSFAAVDPSPVSDHGDYGAEVSPNGNDTIIEEDMATLVRGTTGLGKNDIWQTDTVYHIRIEDARHL